MFDQDNGGEYVHEQPDGVVVDATDVAELDEVDAPATSDESDKPAEEKTTKVVKKSSRPAVPGGYITPVQFAKKLSEKLTAEARDRGELAANEVIEVPPQQIYSYINQARKAGENAKYPIPTYSEGGRQNLLKEDEAFAWWEAKAQRVASRIAGLAGKKTVKPEAAPKADETPIQEAE